MYDIFLFYTLIQSQSSSLQSEIWYPICLPGVSFNDRVFCYINFITPDIIIVIVSDDAKLFPDLSEASKRLKSNLERTGVIDRINLTLHRDIIHDPTFEKPAMLRHFIIRYRNDDDNGLDQIVMSSGNYFGENP